jgi:pimeloyl-ACP methyl ester carboxylesterase
MERVSVRGRVRTVYDRAGDGPAVVLLHGLGDGRGTWAPIVERLQADTTCFAIDLRGHGDSDAPGAYGHEEMVADVEAVLAQEHLSRPLVVGHSFGAVVASMLAARGRAGGVLNVDQGLDLEQLAGALRPFRTVIETGDHVAALHGIIESIGTERLRSEEREALARNRRRLRREVMLGVWAPLLDDQRRAALAPLIATLRSDVPYVAVHGTKLGADYIAWLGALLPRARVEVWDGHGHYPHLVDPERFAERVRALRITV